ncbi:MAG: SoxR reducing system RseC family protein [Desulfobacterium sp.]|nr:SoxR reducing system RseC family protein [Desulfobacterium sp.]
MITKEGMVTNANTTTAWVETVRSKSCESCDACDSCEAQEKSMGMTIKVNNTINAGKGDRVIIGFKTAPLLKMSFMLYIFPIILLIAGAAAGEAFAPRFKMDPSLTSVIAGIISFALAFGIIRKTGDRLSTNREFKPFLVRIDRKGTITPPK